MDEDTDDDEDAAAVAQAVKVLSNKLLKLKHSNSRPHTTYLSEISKAKLTIETSPVGTGEEAAMVRPALD